MRTTLLLARIFTLFALIAGCGGGGSTSGTGPTGPARTTVTGVVSKGPIQGEVKLYAPGANGDTATKVFLGSAFTDSTGYYTANLGSYKGIVIAEATGSYTDEATGATLAIGTSAPLRAVAVIANAGDTVQASITPLTELATRKALAAGSGSVLTGTAIASANALLSNLFPFDILATRPVAPTVIAMSGATQQQRDYTIALAALSKLSAASSLAAVLNSFTADLTLNGRLSAATVASFETAAGAFIADGTNNRTGVTTISAGIAAVGYYTGTLYLATTGTASAPVTSIQMTLKLPAGVTLKTGSDGEALVSLYGVAGQAAAPGINYTAPDTLILAIVSSPGFAVGEFAAVTYVAEPGVIPVASSFTVSYSRVTGFDGTSDFELPLSVVPLLH